MTRFLMIPLLYYKRCLNTSLYTQAHAHKFSCSPLITLSLHIPLLTISRIGLLWGFGVISFYNVFEKNHSSYQFKLWLLSCGGEKGVVVESMRTRNVQEHLLYYFKSPFNVISDPQETHISLTANWNTKEVL